MSGDPTQGSRRLARLAAGALLLVVPAGAWLLAHRLGRRDIPPDPWAEEVLPAVPDAAQNGLDDVVLTPDFGGERPTPSCGTSSHRFTRTPPRRAGRWRWRRGPP